MGGGGGSHTTEYEDARLGVDSRRYGELSKTGIQSIDQYNLYAGIISGRGKTQDDFMREVDDSTYRTKSDGSKVLVGEKRTKKVADTEAYGKYTESLGGATYDSKWNRWKMAGGVDMEAALKDWQNYTRERTEIAEYSAKEARRKEAPDSLTGTAGNVDYSLAITDEDKEKTSVGAMESYDISPSMASTSQSLGIY